MKQPEALNCLKLARELMQVHNGHTDEGPTTFSEASSELRRMNGEINSIRAERVRNEKELKRLHEVNQELLEARKAIQPFIPTTSAKEGGAAKHSANVVAADMVRAAIAKAGGAA